MKEPQAKFASQTLRDLLSVSWRVAGLRSPWRHRVVEAEYQQYVAEAFNGPLVVRQYDCGPKATYTGVVELKERIAIESRPRRNPKGAAEEALRMAKREAARTTVLLTRLLVTPVTGPWDPSAAH